MVAYLLDGLVAAIPVVVVIGIGVALLAADDGQGGGLAAIGGLVLVMGSVVAIGIGIWNQGWRQGEMGQSLGKQAMNITVVGELDGQYLGGGQGLLRWLMMTILGGACFLDFLWPLWDDKSQCWHDMIVDSVVVQTD